MKTNNIKTEERLVAAAVIIFSLSLIFGTITHFNNKTNKDEIDQPFELVEAEEDEMELEDWMMDVTAWETPEPIQLKPIMALIPTPDEHIIAINNRLVNVLAVDEEGSMEIESWMLSPRKLKKAQGI